jgi:hypothetical protein
VVEGVLAHHHPLGPDGEPTLSPALAVHLADAFAHELAGDASDGAELFHPDVLETVPQERLARWRRACGCAADVPPREAEEPIATESGSGSGRRS